MFKHFYDNKNIADDGANKVACCPSEAGLSFRSKYGNDTYTQY